MTKSVFAQSKIETNFENPFSRLNNKEAWSGFKKKGAAYLKSEYGSQINKPVDEFIEIDLPGDSLKSIARKARSIELKKTIDTTKISAMDTADIDSAWLAHRISLDTTAVKDSVVSQFELDSLSDLAGHIPADSTSLDSLLHHKLDSGQYTFQVDTTRLLQEFSGMDTVQLPDQPDHELLANFRKESFLDDYTDHFEKYKGVVESSQKEIQKYKKKEDFKSFIKEFFSNRFSNSDSDSLGDFKRFEMGAFFEVRQDPFFLVCNPSMKVNLTNKLSLGLGYSFSFHFDPIKVDEVYFRSFTQYRFRKYFAHFEAESGEPMKQAGESFKVIPAKYNYAIGIGRNIHLGKLSGSLLILYNFDNSQTQKISLRYGVNIF